MERKEGLSLGGLGIENSSEEKVLRKYSYDTSILEVSPEVVAFPRNSEEIKKLVRFISKNKERFPDLSITARAAGTDMSGGPLNDSIIVSFTEKMNKIKTVRADYAIAEPGVFYRDFEKKTLEKGLFLPSYPASKSICALGGMIANNSGGEKSLAYGKTNRYIEELKVVLSDGNEYRFKKLNRQEFRDKMRQDDFEGRIYRKMHHLLEKNYDDVQKARPGVSKNSAGYYLWNVWDRKSFDLTQLFVGSQGTLGIITEAKIKLVKKKKNSKMIVCFLKNPEELAEFVNTALPFKPESLETFDDATLKLGIKFMPEIARKIGRSFFSMALSFWREALMILRTGIPNFVVLVELTDEDKRSLDDRIKELDTEFKNRGISHIAMKSEKESEKYWVMRRESFNLLRKKVRNKKATPFVDDFVIRPEYLPEFLPKLKKILDEYGIRPTYSGHAGSGNFHIIPLMDLTDEKERKYILFLRKSTIWLQNTKAPSLQSTTMAL